MSCFDFRIDYSTSEGDLGPAIECPTFEECHWICVENEQCQYFTFYESETTSVSYCVMKKGNTVTKSELITGVSGPKYCE